MSGRHLRSFAWMALAGMAALLMAIHSASAANLLPGGELDPAVVGADVYTDMPQSANPGHVPACRVAKQYVDHINAGRYLDAANLFADDALFLEPARKNAEGAAQIKDFYLNVIGPMKPKVFAVAYLGGGSDCMVELTIRANINGKPHYVLASIDHFTVDAKGKVTRMIAFARPTQTGMTLPASDQ